MAYNHHSYGIYLKNSSMYNLINNSVLYDNVFNGCRFTSGAKNNIINDMWAYNNENWIIIEDSDDNIINNVQVYNNSNAWFAAISSASGNTFNNIQSYNNYYGWWTSGSSNNHFNNILTYNNSLAWFGFLYASDDNTVNNLYTYNNTYGIITVWWVASGNKYYGKILRQLCISVIPLIFVMVFYQLYLMMSLKLTIIDKIYVGYKYSLAAEVGCRFLTIAIPNNLFRHEWMYLVFGSVLLFKRNKIYGLWWSILAIVHLLFSYMPHFGIFCTKSALRIFYYYGLFSYLLKSILIIYIAKLLTNTLNANAKLFKKYMKALIIIFIIVFDAFFIPIDMFSFYPIKREISHLQVFHQSKIGESILTTTQYEGLIWLKNKLNNVTKSVIVVSTGRLQIYASFILGIKVIREISYGIPLFESREDIEAIDNIIFGDLIAGTKYFSKYNIDKIYFLIDPTDPLGKKILSAFKEK